MSTEVKSVSPATKVLRDGFRERGRGWIGCLATLLLDKQHLKNITKRFWILWVSVVAEKKINSLDRYLILLYAIACIFNETVFTRFHFSNCNILGACSVDFAKSRIRPWRNWMRGHLGPLTQSPAEHLSTPYRVHTDLMWRVWISLQSRSEKCLYLLVYHGFRVFLRATLICFACNNNPKESIFHPWC